MLLKLSNIGLDYGNGQIFKNITRVIYPGEKIALVGPNGSGKTSLLKIIYGELEPTQGHIERKDGLRIGYQNQFRIENTEIELFDWMREDIDKNDPAFDKRVRSLLKGFGIGEENWNKKLKFFSGGELTRISLAKLFLSSYDLLLFDEPTNHLDLLGIEVFTRNLENLKAAVIMVSHNRYVLKKFAQRFWEINNGVLLDFKGDYNTYIENRERMKKESFRIYQNRLKELNKLEEQARKFLQTGDKKLSKVGKSRLKTFEKLSEQIQSHVLIKDWKDINIELPEPERSGELVLKVKNLSKRFGNRIIFKGVNFEIHSGEKIALLGHNGVGKTTLLNCITGRTNFSGEVVIGHNVKYCFLSQDHQEIFSASTIFEIIKSLVPNWKDYEVRAYAGRFGFLSDDVFKTVDILSGGERLRLSLAINLINRPNFLILDEPTNHLDIPTTQMLESALSNYKGTLLLVSHDRYLVEKVCNRFMVLKENGIFEIDNLESYLEILKTGIEEESKGNENKRDYLEKKKLRNKLKKIKEKMKKFEKEIEELSLKRKNLSEQLFQENDYKKLMEINSEIKKIDNREDEILVKLEELENMRLELEKILLNNKEEIV